MVNEDDIKTVYYDLDVKVGWGSEKTYVALRE
jgi:hypothetical protein